MKSAMAVRVLFFFAGLYDALLGLAFALAAPAIFTRCGVEPPNHFGYVRFPALLIVIFAVMFFAVVIRPQANRNLIPYGILLKLCYSATVIYYWIVAGLPNMWKPFAIVDLLFAAAFVWAYVGIGRMAAAEADRR